MKISSFIQQERISAYENRKKILQRKEAGDAYRKNAQYFQSKKNPVLQELEDLLLGHKDQDLYEKHKEESKEVSEQEQTIIHELMQTEKNVRAHEKAHKSVGSDGSGPISYTYTTEFDEEHLFTQGDVSTTFSKGITEEETLQILEQVRHAALAPGNPSPQDLRVAASASAQMQQVQAKLYGTEDEGIEQIEEEPHYVRENIEIKVPERYTKELKLDPYADTIFGKSYEEAYKARAFNYVSEKYATHIQMVKNGYKPGNESRFSLTA